MASGSEGPEEFTIASERDAPARLAAAERFAGEVQQQDVLPARKPGGLRGNRFAYAPGARSAWHIHHGEQALVVTEGEGLIQWEGLDEPRTLGVGDWIHVMPGVPHWHGATEDSEFVHLAITASGPTEWLRHVDPEDDSED